MRTKKEPASEFTLAMYCVAEENPMVIWPFRKEHVGENQIAWDEISYLHHPAIDTEREPLVRVFPTTGKDVAFLRMLQQRVDKFAPATGGGILVKSRLIYR